MMHLHIKGVSPEQPRFENVIHLSDYENINDDSRLELLYLICFCAMCQSSKNTVFVVLQIREH